MAPNWPIVMWIPNAFPDNDSDTESAIKASRGAVLIPLPILSIVLTINASNQLLATTKKGLLMLLLF